MFLLVTGSRPVFADHAAQNSRVKLNRPSRLQFQFENYLKPGDRASGYAREAVGVTVLAFSFGAVWKERSGMRRM